MLRHSTVPPPVSSGRDCSDRCEQAAGVDQPALSESQECIQRNGRCTADAEHRNQARMGDGNERQQRYRSRQPVTAKPSTTCRSEYPRRSPADSPSASGAVSRRLKRGPARATRGADPTDVSARLAHEPGKPDGLRCSD